MTRSLAIACVVAGFGVSGCNKSPVEPSPDCTSAVTPAVVALSAAASTTTITVTVASGCSWSAQSQADGLTVSAGATGEGPGAVTVAATENANAAPRTGAVTVAGHAVSITQAAAEPEPCAYSISPESASFAANGGTGVAAIATASGCGWTASTSASLLGLSQTSGNGAASIAMQVGENYDAPRQATLMIRWPTPTAGQNVRVNQAGCRYFVSSSAFAVAAAGATFSVTVVQQSDPLECGGPKQDRCVWSAVADVPWITITTAMPQTGDGLLTFSVLANTGGARSSVIRLRDQTIRVDQASISLLQWQSRARRLLFSLRPGGV